MVKIGNDRDPRRASPAGSDDGGLGIVTIDVKQPRRSDPFPAECGRRQPQARVALPENGSLASFAVHENNGLMADTITDGDEVGFHPRATQNFLMHFSGG